MPRLFLILLTCLLTVGLLVTGPWGEAVAQPSRPVEKKSNARKPESREPVDASQESAALAFAREHHRELAELIETLKERSRRDYERAIQDLSRTRERLVRLQDQRPRLYETELKSWKVDSRIRLLQAKMTMSSDKQFDDQLKELLSERAELRVERLKAERDMLKENLRKLEDRLADAERARDQGVEQELARLKQRLAGRKPSKPAKSKPMPAAVRADGKGLPEANASRDEADRQKGRSAQKPSGKPDLSVSPESEL